ncbi:MAG: HAD-IIIC family phosphatase [bacterium]|nr:HAD-IIIC family phosphatase [bacterium]
MDKLSDIKIDLGYAKLVKLAKKLKDNLPDSMMPLKLAVIGQSTTHFLVPLLEMFLWKFRIKAEIYESPYNIAVQELTEPSDLSNFKPDITIILPEENSLPATDVSAAVSQWQSIWDNYHRRTCSKIIQGNYVLPAYEPFGHLSASLKESRSLFLKKLNLALAENLPTYVHIHDTDQLASNLGRRRFCENSWRYAAEMHVSPSCLPELALSLVSLCAAISGKSKKVLALDLDNTLWGGTVGESGAAALEIGGSPSGRAFTDFQRYIKSLKDRGVILTVISKNDPDVALEPFSTRPEMILKEQDFALFRASWEDKPKVLKEMAAQLRLGLDAFVFVDDHPGEREMMRQMIPEVYVLDLPEDPAYYIEALDKARLFEPAFITEEDKKRSDMYRAEAKRQELEKKLPTREEYLQSLNMTLTIGMPGDLIRVSQLLGKTNQFNLTGRKFSPEELEKDNILVLSARLSDIFGEQGLISAIILEKKNTSYDILNWIMSCRVLKRGVEEGLFAFAAQFAKKHKIQSITGRYVPSARNKMVEELLSSMGFQKSTGNEYIFNTEKLPTVPKWLDINCT